MAGLEADQAIAVAGVAFSGYVDPRTIFSSPSFNRIRPIFSLFSFLGFSAQPPKSWSSFLSFSLSVFIKCESRARGRARALPCRLGGFQHTEGGAIFICTICQSTEATEFASVIIFDPQREQNILLLTPHRTLRLRPLTRRETVGNSAQCFSPTGQRHNTKNPQGLWELEWLLAWIPCFLFCLRVFFFICGFSFLFAGFLFYLRGFFFVACFLFYLRVSFLFAWFLFICVVSFMFAVCPLVGYHNYEIKTDSQKINIWSPWVLPNNTYWALKLIRLTEKSHSMSFWSHIAFLFCSWKYFYFGQLAYEICTTNLHTISMSQAKAVQTKPNSSFIFLINEAVDQ